MFKDTEFLFLSLQHGAEDENTMTRQFVSEHTNAALVLYSADPGLYEVWNFAIKHLARSVSSLILLSFSHFPFFFFSLLHPFARSFLALTIFFLSLYMLRRSDYITNWNVDDRKHPESLYHHYRTLQDNPSATMVSSAVHVTFKPNLHWEQTVLDRNTSTWWTWNELPGWSPSKVYEVS